jgi:hypothetical protein
MEDEEAHDEDGDTTDDHVCYIARTVVASQRWPTFDMNSNWRGTWICQAHTTGLGQLIRVITDLLSIRWLIVGYTLVTCA